MGSTSDWHAFLEEFRAFGGKAENVVQRKGTYGMGLFPIDPAKPIELMVPDELLVAINNIELRGGNVVIKDEKNFPNGYTDWFSRYQSNYSWGAEGRENIMAFEKGLKALPSNVQELMKHVGLYNSEKRFPGKDPDQELIQRFIQTRCIFKKDRKVIIPMIDLLNHAPTAKTYDMRGNGISVKGMHDGEILVKYSVSDPLRRLITYGFNAQEQMGFSLSLRIQHRGQMVIVQGGLGRQPLQPCKVELRNDRIVLQQPLLASNSYPKLPRTLVIKALKNIEGIEPNELFEQIHQGNTQVLVQLLRGLDNVRGEVAQRLRTGCLDQLAALSHHYGQRNDLISENATTPQHA